MQVTKAKLILMQSNGEEITLPFDIPNLQAVTTKTIKKQGLTPERRETKKLISSKFIRNTSLPMWLADLACKFDVEDKDFYEKKLKPVLQTRSGDGRLLRFANQVNSLKRFLLLNFPDIVTQELKDFINQRELKEVAKPRTLNEEKLFKEIQLRLTNLTELNKLHRAVQKMNSKTLDKNRIAKEFGQIKIFKESFTNITNS